MDYISHDLKDPDVEEEVTKFVNYLNHPLYPHRDIDLAIYFRNVLKRFKHHHSNE